MSALPDPLLDLRAWRPLLRGRMGELRSLALDFDDRAARAGLEHAWRSVEPGGTLAVSVAGAGSLARGVARRLGRPAALERAARALGGAARVERYYRMPATGGGYVLLEARDGRAVRAGLELLPAGRARWRAAGAGLAALARLGLARRLGFDELLVIDRGAEPGREHGDGRGAGCADPRGREAPLARFAGARRAVTSGVPGLSRRIVCQLADDRGQPAAFLRAAPSRAASDAIEREAAALARLESLGLASELAPRLLAAGELDGRAFTLQEALPGERGPAQLGEPHARFLARIAERAGSAVPLDSLPTWRDSAARLRELEGRAEPRWLEAFIRLQAALARGLERELVPTAPAHGDFTPWNLRLSRGRLLAFDWEHAREAAPLCFDAFHHVVQTGVLVERDPPLVILDDVAAALRGDVGRALGHALATAPGWRWLFGLYLLDVATFDARLHAVERPPFEQVSWLLEARLELAARISADLERALATAAGRGEGRAA